MNPRCARSLHEHNYAHESEQCGEASAKDEDERGRGSGKVSENISANDVTDIL